MRLERLLILGLDGATYDVLLPLAEAGVMPNLRTLLRTAALANLNSTRPAITPTAWSTFLTGCGPELHGVFDYRRLDCSHSALCLQQARDLRRPSFLARALSCGAEVISLNVPMTAALDDPRGLIVGGIDWPSAEAALAPYPDFRHALRRRGIELSLDTIWERPPESLDELAIRVAATERDFLDRSAAARVADEQRPDWRLLLVQFQALDALQHRAWHLLAGVGGQAPTAWSQVLRRAFVALDAAVGELLELAQRRGAGAMVLSDHGFGPFREKISMPELLRRRGLLYDQTWSQGFLFRGHRSWLKLRKWARRHLSRDGSAASVKKSLAGLLPCDWRRTVAFSAHCNLGALVYLHGARRFGEGPLVTPAQEEQVAAEVLAALGEARHPDTDEPLFSEVFRSAQRFDCDPVEHGWPDIIGIPADGFHTRHRFDRGHKLMRPDPSLTGTHRAAGVLMLDVPGAAGGEMHEAEMRDVAPTILRLLGLPGGEEMQGQVLTGMCPSLLFDARQGTLPPSSQPLSLPDNAVDEEAAILARLRNLGYLD
ncbi:MAG: alkaline phosphatase family protein [Pirellulales bacterium]|nr:alkaline phosphatase family protein [Pirellulales bacterium]